MLLSAHPPGPGTFPRPSDQSVRPARAPGLAASPLLPAQPPGLRGEPALCRAQECQLVRVSPQGHARPRGWRGGAHPEPLPLRGVHPGQGEQTLTLRPCRRAGARDAKPCCGPWRALTGHCAKRPSPAAAPAPGPGLSLRGSSGLAGRPPARALLGLDPKAGEQGSPLGRLPPGQVGTLPPPELPARLPREGPARPLSCPHFFNMSAIFKVTFSTGA